MRQEAMGFWEGSGVSWTTCKQSAPRTRQITTPTPHRSIFTGRMLFLMPSQRRQSTEGTSLFHYTDLSYYQPEVDGKPVGEYFRPGTHTQTDGQTENIVPSAHLLDGRTVQA